MVVGDVVSGDQQAMAKPSVRAMAVAVAKFVERFTLLLLVVVFVATLLVTTYNWRNSLAAAQAVKVPGEACPEPRGAGIWRIWCRKRNCPPRHRWWPASPLVGDRGYYTFRCHRLVGIPGSP